MKTPASMSLLQLSLVLQAAPERAELWNEFERAARDEYDQRVVALEAGRAAA